MAKSRNPELIPGVNRFGRHKASSKRYIHFKKGEKGKKIEKKAAPKQTNTQESRWYSVDQKPTPIPSRKNHHKPCKLRASITPGTVLIVLAGRFRGKRVIFLKQLKSGLLLVTGPYKINGVPLRRLNQAYVIATSTKLDISKVDVSKIDDSLFKKAEEKKKKKDEKEFFADNQAKKNVISSARKDAQKAVDAPLLGSIKAVPEMAHYLNAKFSLTKGQKPHLLKF